MAKNFLRQQNQNSSSKTSLLRLARKLFILLFFLPLFSCTDQGCIEADDFGDYEYQTLIVPANGLGTSCTYDYSLDITDANQGSGLTTYLTSGDATVTDSNGDSQNGASGKGCSGFNDANLQNLCIHDAIQKCLSVYNSVSATSDPNWTSTSEHKSSQNYGVTITPGAEITIKAVGSVKLGDQVSFSDSYVSAQDLLPTLKKENLTADLFFDVKSGQTINIKFSGQWFNGTNIIGGGSTVSIGDNDDNKIYNGARRAVLYLIPAPYGYKFDTSATTTTEQEGTSGVPLLPDTKAWQCTYTGSASDPANCSNKDYSTIGYTHITSSSTKNLINSTFPLTSSAKSAVLGQYGGMIRWSNDGIVSDGSFDPFANGTPAGIADGGMVLGDASAGVSIQNTTFYSYKIAFRSTNASCNIPINVSIKDSNGNTLQSYGSRIYPVPINLSSSWSPGDYTNEIALEPTQQVVVDSIPTLPGSPNCGTSIQIKFVKYHEIDITQSGMVSFTMLNGSSGTCNLHGSIINPKGSHLDVGTITADFYEYDPIDNDSNPLYNLEVSSRPDNSDNGWTSGIFVRKGQRIRFSPESWNGTWYAVVNGTATSTNCGTGMAMKIAPRPALLCRGVNSDTVDNPACNKEYSSTGKLNGCLAQDQRCNEPSNTSYYCPSACQRIITCNTSVTDSSGQILQKSCSAGSDIGDGNQKCVLVDGVSSCSTCKYERTSYGVTPTYETCSSCASFMAYNGSQPTTIEKNVDQCYDLENYTGKVSNIPIDTGFTDLSDTSTAKGATKLGRFNGQYGNFDSFNDTKTTDTVSHNSNKIYQTTSPIIFSQAGRVKLLLLDGSDFLNIASSYSDNSGGSYSGSNGFAVNSSGNLEYSNGEMLAAKLCGESSSNSCSGSNPTALNPLIIEYNPTSSSTTPLATSNYYFSSSGSLIRSTEPTGANECVNSDGKTAVTSAGGTFYCHNQTLDSSKMRLTFKIIDPETTNCNIEDPKETVSEIESNPDGILMPNPAYTTEKQDPNNPTKSIDISGETTNHICQTGEVPSIVASSDTKCTKEYYCANKYTNNSGQYLVTVKTKKIDDGNISQVISNVVTPVVEIIDGSQDGSTPGQAERIYKLLISDTKYQTILSLSLSMMIMFYALSTLMGVSEITHTELVNRVIKIGLIYLFVGPEGWYWFNEIVVKFFKNSTDYLAFMMASSFDNSQGITDALQNNDYYDKSILFGSVDKVFNMFFSDAVQKKISALLFANVFGFIYMWIIYLSFMLYVGAVCHAVLYYLTAQVFISILFIIAPIFFVLTLFGQTKDMFDNWLKQLIGFSLQQIFLLVTLAFFNMMMYEVIRMALGYKICWDVVWSIKIIGTIDLLSFWTIPSVSSAANSQVGNISGQDGIPSLFSILFIWVIASLMNKFIGFMTDLAAGISGGMKASALGGGVKSTFQSFHKYAKDRYNDIYKGSIGKQIERLDEKLFDSGAQASANRKKRREQNFQNAQKKGVLRDIGNKAVEEYKKNNAMDLLFIDEKTGKPKFEGKELVEEQRKKLLQVKNDAMIKHGKEKLGLSEDDTKKLLSSKGSTYEGSNVFGLALHSGRQLISGGGTLTKSINDEGVSTKFSEKQAKSAAKKKRMSDENRGIFQEAVEKGHIKVERNALGKLKGAIGNPLKTARSAVSSAKNSFSEGYDSIRSAMGGGSYRAAEKALEARGEISKMAYGTSFARTDEEKNKILAEQKKMKTAEENKREGELLNNPYAVKNFQKALEKTSGVKSDKTDKERVAENKEQNLRNRDNLLNKEKENLEEKFKTTTTGDDGKTETSNISNADLNEKIRSLEKQQTFSNTAKALFSKEARENRNKVNSSLKDLKRLRKLRDFENSSKTANEKYENDKKSVKDLKAERELKISKSSMSNRAKDVMNAVTFGKAFKGRAKAKEEWNNSPDKKKYEEAKKSVKRFQNISLKKGVSGMKEEYDKYSGKKPPNNESSASSNSGGDLVGQFSTTLSSETTNPMIDEATAKASYQETSKEQQETLTKADKNMNETNKFEETSNPMISKEVADKSYMEEPKAKNKTPEEKPKVSLREEREKSDVHNPLQNGEDT